MKGPPIPSGFVPETLPQGRRDHFLIDVAKQHRMYPLNMQGVNPLRAPKAPDRGDDIERTLKVSHVDQMPTKENNYYQALLRKVNKRKQVTMRKSTMEVP